MYRCRTVSPTQFSSWTKKALSSSKRSSSFSTTWLATTCSRTGSLWFAHAGMKEEMQGRGSGKVRDFALYGETTGETDDYGLPVRYNWAAEYRGTAMVVYGNTPIAEREWLNRTIKGLGSRWFSER